MPDPPPLRNRGCHVASLGKLVKWMAKEAESLGVDLFCEFAGREILVEDGRVAGVRTGDRGVGKDGRPKPNFEPGVDVRAQVTLLGEGPRGTLARQLEARLGLTQGRNPQVYAIGLKEIWELPDGRFEAGEMWHSMGWPLWPEHYGGGFVYGMRDRQLIVGLVVGLDYENPWTDPHLEFQRFKTHPELRRLLAGGRMAYYGAKAIPEGGFWAMPRLGGDGFCLLGDSGGFLDSQRLKGIHLAMKSDRTLFCELGSDGMTLDAEGNVYLTGKGVSVFDKNGRKIDQINVGEPWTANVCFGGTDRQTLFITASKGLYSVRLRVKGAGPAK